MQITPLVSVIIPTHNRPDLLLEALASVDAQTMTDWQVIIVDDGSIPAVNEQQIQAQLGTKFQVIRHPAAQGGPAAKNTGVNAATGRYLAFLDDDDLFAPTFLANAIEALEANPQITTLFMGVDFFGNDMEWSKNAYDDSMEKTLSDAHGLKITEHLTQFDSSLFSALLKRVSVGFQQPVTTRARFHEVGLFQEDCLLWDCDWALRAALNSVCGFLNLGLYLQRTSGQSYSSMPSRRLEHTLSGFAIKKQLLADPRAAAYKNQIAEALMQTGRDLAWENMAQGKGLRAVIILLGTFRYGISKLQLKFLLHALLSCVRKT